MIALLGLPQLCPSSVRAEGIEEVTVTSRRIEETLQTTGASIAVFTQKNLDDLGVTTLTDLANYAPNVLVEAKGGSASMGLTLKIRGIGVSTVDYLYSDPSVAVYIDGVFQPRAQGPQFDLFDLERIEILRGPQGTLYGKNTLGGAINILTRKPDAAPGAEVGVTVGNFGALNVTGRANMALIDRTLFGNLAVFSVKHDGFYNNLYPAERDPASENRQAIRGALRWIASDAVSVDWVSDHTYQHQASPAWFVETLTPGSLAYRALQDAGFSTSAYVLGAHPSPSQLRDVALDDGAGVGSFLPPNAGARGRSADDGDFNDESLVIAADLTSDMTLRSLTGYQNFDRFVARDLDGTPAAIADQVYSDDGHSLSSELQLNAKLLGGRGNLVLGAFALQENMHEDQANDFLLGLAEHTPSLRSLSHRQVRAYENTSAAAYGHLIFSLTEALRVTGGIRYSWERKQDREIDSVLATNVVSADIRTARSWNSTTPQIGAEYSLGDDVFLYSTISKGYASGGFSSALTGVGIQVYNPESLWNYEAGIKTAFFGRTLVFNASAFFMDYDNIVVQSFQAAANGVPLNVYANAGRAHVRGMDAQWVWQPTKALSINAGLGLLSQRFLQFGIGADGLPISAGSAHFFDSPSVTVNSTFQYALPLNPDYGVATIEGGWSYRSRTYFDNTYSITSSQNPFSVFNANLSYRFPREHLSATLYGDNLSNRIYLLRTANLLSSLGYTLGQFGPPRTYGLRLRYGF
jgi:iron complex outermembrane recepter protein